MRSRVVDLEIARTVILNQFKKTEDLLEREVFLKRREELEKDCIALRSVDDFLLERLRRELE